MPSRLASPAPQGEAFAVTQGDAFALYGNFLGDQVKRVIGGLQQGTMNADLHAYGDIGCKEPLRAYFDPEQALVVAQNGEHQEFGLFSVHLFIADALHLSLDVSQFFVVEIMEGWGLGQKGYGGQQKEKAEKYFFSVHFTSHNPNQLKWYRNHSGNTNRWKGFSGNSR